MSWGFDGLSAAVPNGASRAHAGSELETIETEQLGFQALGVGRTVRLLLEPWSSQAPPSKTASLLGVASSRGLLAAVSPDTLYLYTTDSIRSAFSRELSKDEEQASSDALLEHTTATKIPRVSHLAFTSDEQALVITSETGGGLAIYDVNAASSGANWTPSMQIATNGVAVRHLLPNPNRDFAHLLAVVLADGKLVIADLKSQALVTNSNGNPVFKDNVSSASWSKLGKQIVAGLSDGSAVQLDMKGTQKEQIPSIPGAEGGLLVSAIYWLENQDFLLVYTPAQANTDSMTADAQIYLVHRDQQTKDHSFHRFLVDPCPAFLEHNLPAHHFMLRIRDWQPNLDDSIICACSASTDIGVFTRSKVPLSQDLPADQITHTYTTTSFTDTRRAALPMSKDGVEDTFPIGVALDLSSKQKVKKPIPNDETLDESASPLPQFCILNQEGYLSAWWYIYNEAVRADQLAPGMLASNAAQPPNSQGLQTSTTVSTPPPSNSASAHQSAFGQPSTPAFGQSSGLTFGKSTFGSVASFGQNASPWATGNTTAASTQSTFGKPSFGAPTQVGLSTGSPAFGQVGGSFNKPSVWGTTPASGVATNGPVFGSGSTFGGNAGKASPFAAFAASKTTAAEDGKPAASFASNKAASSPFASFSTQDNKLSPFATKKPGMPDETSFGSTVTLPSNSISSFGSGVTFGAPSKSFGQSDDTKEKSMRDGDTPREEKTESSALGSLTGFKLGSTFKPDVSAKDDQPKAKDVKSSLFGLNFGNALNDDKEQKPDTAPVIKQETDDSQTPALRDIPEAPSKQATPAAEAAPLPPDFVKSKSKPSISTDAPLPPDFLTSKPPSTTPIDAPLPPDFLPPQRTSAAKTQPAEDAPLPPDFVQATPKAIQSSVPAAPAGSDRKPEPTMHPDAGPEEDDDDVENDDYSSEALEDGDDDMSGELENEEGVQDEDSEEWDDEDEDEFDGIEDQDEDETEEQSPAIVDPKRLSAFEARITPASPKKDVSKEKSTTPESTKKPSFTPVGFPKAPLAFDPPRKLQESPRSPSPVRAATNPVHPTQRRSQSPRTTFKHSAVKKSPAPRSSLFVERPQTMPTEDLEDEDDRRTKQILDAPVEPTTTLPDFIAHQDYTGGSKKDGIAGQLETVYRDVNSMIDTLGLNARALLAFVEGHESAKRFSEDDLDDPETWILSSLPALENLQTRIGDQLDSGRITEVEAKIHDVAEQDEQMTRISAKSAELRKQIKARTDPTQRAQQQAAPLPQAWATQQIELRQSLQQVQKLLAEVEDSITLLRADLASASAASAEPDSTAVPTVQAVENTILKMVAMIEKRSGDVDVLESQIRRLPGGIASLGMPADYEDSLADNLAASRLSNSQSQYSTPLRKARTRQTNGEALGMSGMLGSSMKSSMTFDGSASMLGRSTASMPGSARKKMSDVNGRDIEIWKGKVGRRRKILNALRDTMENVGEARIVHVNES